MNDAIGYYILCRVWVRLLADIHVEGHNDALDIISGLKQAIIRAEGSDLQSIRLVQNLQEWCCFHEVPTLVEVNA